MKTTGDKPSSKYASCCMAACSSGRHFGIDLNKKTLFYTNYACYAVLGKDATPLYGWELNGRSYTTTHYVRLLVQGKSFAEIQKFLNDNQYYYSPKTPNGPQHAKMWGIK